MTDKPTPTTDLLKRCAEIHEWRSTGLLSGEALRDYAKRKWSGRLDTLQMAEHETVTEALALLAKWGQLAQAAEPVAVVVPCYTPSGKRVALCSAKQDLPIGTKLYTAPQPSPTTQAAESVPAPEYVGNGMFKGETIQKAAEHWANWCDRRCMNGLAEFLRVVAAHALADSVTAPAGPSKSSQAQAGAVPLTIDEVEQLIAQWSYELHGDRARYLVRMTEQHHGIKGGQHGTDN